MTNEQVSAVVIMTAKDKDMLTKDVNAFIEGHEFAIGACDIKYAMCATPDGMSYSVLIVV